MSKHLVSLVYRKKIGSSLRKSVLSYMADRANDDGTGVWCSKQTIANEIEASRQGVITTIQAFVSEGLLVEVGPRKCANGFTMEYTIDVQKLAGLAFVTGKHMDPSKIGPVNPVDGDPSTPFTSPVNPVDTNLPKPPLEPKSMSDRVDPPNLDLALETIWKAWSKSGRQRSKSKALCRQSLKRLSANHDLRDITRAALRYARSTEGEFHKGLDRWLSGGYFENFLPPKAPSALPQEPSSDVERAFEAFAKTGEWTGDRFGLPLPPNHPASDYPGELYARFNIKKPLKDQAA